MKRAWVAWPSLKVVETNDYGTLDERRVELGDELVGLNRREDGLRCLASALHDDATGASLGRDWLFGLVGGVDRYLGRRMGEFHGDHSANQAYRGLYGLYGSTRRAQFKKALRWFRHEKRAVIQPIRHVPDQSSRGAWLAP